MNDKPNDKNQEVIIIGAGPVGLFQVFELGLLGIRARLIDSLPQVGGQCAELYPEKPIYDIPALPVVGAQELVDRLLRQIEPFEPEFHLGQTVETLETLESGGFRLGTSKGGEYEAGALIIAAGLGAFAPRRLRAKGAADFEGSQVHYKVTDPAVFDGQRIAVLGGGDSALDWALELQPRAQELTLIHRRAEYRAQPHSVNQMEQRVAAGQMRKAQGQVLRVLEQDGRLCGLEVRDADGNMSQVACDQILVFWGLSPNLGPIADWGLDVEKRQIPVDTEKFQTNIPGIFAVGDINTYPGKKKLILSGFHEAALAAYGVQKHLHPDQRVFLQYTTTSPLMHERLGVD